MWVMTMECIVNFLNSMSNANFITELKATLYHLSVWAGEIFIVKIISISVHFVDIMVESEVCASDVELGYIIWCIRNHFTSNCAFFITLNCIFFKVCCNI